MLTCIFVSCDLYAKTKFLFRVTDERDEKYNCPKIILCNRNPFTQIILHTVLLTTLERHTMSTILIGVKVGEVVNWNCIFSFRRSITLGRLMGFTHKREK
jgi:hypothetical protein